MLTHVEVRSDYGTVLTLPMQDITDGFIVEEIEGLDPVPATLVSSSFAQLDGEQFQSAKREKRVLLFKLALAPDFVNMTVQDLRNILYRFFMPKTRVRLRFFSLDHPTVDIEGRVEKFVAPKFQEEPTAGITIVCFNSDFVDLSSVVIPGSSTAGATEVTHNYLGTVETGFLFTLNPNRNVTDFTLYNRAASDELMALDFEIATPIGVGDKLEISTTPGNKYAQVTRGTTVSSILYGVSPRSNWVQLQPGLNRLRVFAEGAAVPYTIAYTPKYGGL